jgi:UDP-N-acetylmuramate: L-alanyl-gamma-D-glutamyl-meso-diaminopimelate ligase
MSTQLAALGVEVVEGFEAAQLEPAPDVVVVGNVMTRGAPVIEALLERQIPFESGPEWLAREVLRDRWVLAVAGTHGKTSTTSMLAWILECAGLSPGFLIGGVPHDFGISARLGERPFFVIEADEYDTAFFDKRAKFVHYRPRTVILNNLEFDHADIYPDVAAIEKQFHHLVRTVPSSGLIVHHATDPHLATALQMGCWTPREAFGRDGAPQARWSARLGTPVDGSQFEVLFDDAVVGRVRWTQIGGHNVDNALAAIAPACRPRSRARRSVNFAASSAAWNCAATQPAYGFTTTSHITRRRSPPRSRACDDGSAASASWPCSSHARRP